jgi:hypothetical protein
MDTLTGQRPASSSPWGCRLGVLNGLADHIACAAAVPLRTAAAVVRQRRPRRRHRPSRQLHCRELRHRGRRAWRHCHQRGRANGEPAAAADAAARDLAFAVLSRRHPARRQLEDTDPAAGVTYVAAAVSDLVDCVGKVFRLALARDSVRAAKFLIAREPTAYRGSGWHRRIGTDCPKAFTVDEAVGDRIGDLGAISGRTAALRRVLGLHGAYQRSCSAGAITPPALCSGNPDAREAFCSVIGASVGRAWGAPCDPRTDVS